MLCKLKLARISKRKQNHLAPSPSSQKFATCAIRDFWERAPCLGDPEHPPEAVAPGRTVRKLGLLRSCPWEGTLSCVGSPSLCWTRMRQKRRRPTRNNFHFLNQVSVFGRPHTFLPTPKPLLKLYLEIPPSSCYYGINMLFFMASELTGTPLPSSPKKFPLCSQALGWLHYLNSPLQATSVLHSIPTLSLLSLLLAFVSIRVWNAGKSISFRSQPDVNPNPDSTLTIYIEVGENSWLFWALVP